ncbi:hypothetical protein COL26b_001262 [Colletotrichum chrysophilum]|uniref:uncharacterized protein n=1 Tax=Colletotrichum chrysophilum TaxID=1836956 RepID=UPI0022FFCAC0|nr:uncharacterized protein COL26b_001262 [Colletotrichum chrysophilum]KAJ0380556.1 hypothetical protein COL26b_001262 [Colletotrichum chrysophilum]
MAKQTEDERGRLDPPASTTARPKADRHGSDHKVGENWFLEMRASCVVREARQEAFVSHAAIV